MDVGKHEPKVIGLIMEDIFTDFAKEVIRGVENAAKELRDIRLIVLVGRQNEDTEQQDRHHRYKTVYNFIYRLEETSSFDGLILTLPNLNAIERDSYGLDKIRNFERIPKVFIATTQTDDTKVNYDNESGIREAMEYVVKQRGLRKICMLGGRDDNTDAMERKQIFMDYLRENGLEYTEDQYERTDMSAWCNDAANRLLDRNPDAQAIFCINDPAASALYTEMKLRGKEPGKDILVFGFDNTHTASTMIPPLASIGPKEESLGKTALELLLKKMNGEHVRSAVIRTRFFGRSSCPYEWYQYSPQDLLHVDDEFIDKMFDDCFYRYANEVANDGSMNLREQYHHFISIMLGTLQRGGMNESGYLEVSALIEQFFEDGAMDYSDATKILSSLEKLQSRMNMLQQSPVANVWLNRLFVKIKDCAIMTLSGQKSKRNKWINSGRENMLDFLIDTMDFDRTGTDAIENIINNFDKIGIPNGALFLYDVPVNYVYNGVTIFPDKLNIMCVMKEGKLYVVPKEERSCSIKDIFKIEGLSSKCLGYVTFPVFYGCRIYGILLGELTPETPDRGEYTVSMLSRTLYCNDIEIFNSPVELERLEETKRARHEQEIYNQIAEGLASHYDIIYYVNSVSGRYMEFKANDLFGNLIIQEEGKDFFSEVSKNVVKVVHPEDIERITMILGKDHLITALDDRKQLRADYRITVGGKPQYTRLTVMWGSDQVHFIIGVENINEEVRKEEEHVKALRMANDLARRDALTGAKNITAFREFEESLQKDIEDDPNGLEFAFVVCDVNYLKHVNDTYGHKAGDEYIRSSCQMIFEIFAHSPVFRVGGDEFVVILKGSDYQNREALLAKIRGQVLENQERSHGPVVATGLATYVSGKDQKATGVFERADKEMYLNKDELKRLLHARDDENQNG
ncbi:MAG: GGDEF domain-containing protein [Lachnospiraceae bacterium]|nr:GGDEF domain-containing protein [Lachnospiraceae bacterium]